MNAWRLAGAFCLLGIACASFLNAAPNEAEPRAVQGHYAANCDRPSWTSFRRSLEEGLGSGFLLRLDDVHGGSQLSKQVSEYMEARAHKDIVRVLGFLLDLDFEHLEAQRTFYQRELDRETLLRYTVVAVKPLEDSSTDYQVFSVVVVTVDAKCYEDVLTTRWRRTHDGWKLLPSGGVEPVS